MSNLEKQCNCISASSGPRVITNSFHDEKGFHAKSMLANMACDECDKPWKDKNTLKERPILFSGDMVRAILDGRKTQTRRIIKDYPEPGTYEQYPFRDFIFDEGRAWIKVHNGDNAGFWIPCPYGQPSDRLWVRETWAEMCKVADDFYCSLADSKIDEIHHKEEHHYFEYKADTGDKYPGGWPEEEAKGNPDVPRWKSPLFMPRAASRITLEITNIRVERLQDITEEDAIREGVECPEFEREDHDFKICPQCGGTRLYTSGGLEGARFDTDCMKCDTNKKRFRHLWESIKGESSWDLNPWVWVIEFKKL